MKSIRERATIAASGPRITQAPMAGVQGSALALAVSNAGGIGSLPCAMLSPDALRSGLDTLRASGARSFNPDFFSHTPLAIDDERERAWCAAFAPYCRELNVDPTDRTEAASRTPFDTETADLIEAFRPVVVSFHFGVPAPDLLARVKSWGRSCSLAQPRSRRRAGCRRAA